MDKEDILSKEILEFSNVDKLLKNIELLEFAKDHVLLIVSSYIFGNKYKFDESDYYNKILL